MEYLYSDEGQLGWLKGYCHPIRFNDLAAKNGKIPADLLAAAAAGSLCQGRVPDARRTGGRQGSHRQAVGHRRRRQREVNMASVGNIADSAAVAGNAGSAVALRPGPLRWIARLRLVDTLAVAPFILFAILFLVLPLVYLFVQAFQTQDGAFTLNNIAGLFVKPEIATPSGSARRIRAASAALRRLCRPADGAGDGGRAGFAEWIGNAVMASSGVASDFAGIPLAFAFLTTLGRLGLITVLLKALGAGYWRGSWRS